MKRKSGRISTSPDLYLPPEILAGILSRLPVKPLLRFRCVSNSWQSLIESPDFISLHFINYTQNPNNQGNHINPRIITCESYLNDYYGPINVVIRRSDTFRETMRITSTHFENKWVGGYVNGVLLLYHPRHEDMFLVNPSIRRWIKLPPSPPLLPTRVMYAGLAFCNGDYKVVGIMVPYHWRLCLGVGYDGVVDPKKTKQVSVEIYSYSLKERCWKSIAAKPLYLPLGDDETVAFVNDAMHWIGYDAKLKPMDVARYEELRIIAFDVVKEKLNYF